MRQTSNIEDTVKRYYLNLNCLSVFFLGSTRDGIARRLIDIAKLDSTSSGSIA